MSTCEEEERVRGLSLTSICMVQNTGVRLQQAVQPDHHLQQLLKKATAILSQTHLHNNKNNILLNKSKITAEIKSQRNKNNYRVVPAKIPPHARAPYIPPLYLPLENCKISIMELSVDLF